MFKKMLAIMVSVLLIAAPCWSAVEVKDDGATVGIANSINFTGSAVTLSNSVAAVTLNDLDSGTVDGTVIGGNDPAAGTFTTLTADTSMTLGSQTITSFGSVVSPWTDQGTTTTLNAAPTLVIATHSSGDLFATGFTVGTGDLTFGQGAKIDGDSNNYIKLIEASDTLSFYFDTNDVIVDFKFNSPSAQAAPPLISSC